MKLSREFILNNGFTFYHGKSFLHEKYFITIESIDEKNYLIAHFEKKVIIQTVQEFGQAWNKLLDDATKAHRIWLYEIEKEVNL